MRSPSLVFNSARDTLYRILGPSQSSESQTRIAVCGQAPPRPRKVQFRQCSCRNKDIHILYI